MHFRRFVPPVCRVKDKTTMKTIFVYNLSIKQAAILYYTTA